MLKLVQHDGLFIKPEIADSYALKPTDFHGVIPKLLVKPEQKVKAGSPLYFNKNNPDIIFT